MKLYINPLTVNSIKILLLCNALQIKPEFIIVALNKGEHRSDNFLVINPEGKVPVLQKDDLLLTESNAILQYLATKYQSSLWSDDFTNQAKILSVLFWQSSYFNLGVGPLAHHKVVMPFWGFQRSKIEATQMTKFHHALDGLEAMLKENNFVAGNTVSIADISLVAFFIFANKAEMPLKPYPLTQGWLRNISTQAWFIETKRQLDNILSGNNTFN
jgi:glutathione S-transferase